MRLTGGRVRSGKVDVRKATAISIGINSLQILMVLLTFLHLQLTGRLDSAPVLILCVLTLLVVSGGAALDIWDAFSQRLILEQVDDMDATIEDLEKLNHTIRAQRHDFLNHLQVVYSLMEMGEYEEAGSYIEKVYGAINAVSRTLKTANPSINALLQVKTAACESQGITVHLNIQSRWDQLPMPGWEMCKVLSNLLDNAMDALQEVEERELTVTLSEDLHAYRFSVENNGPMIPVGSRKSIFNPGVTGKGSGHGMGLYIVRQTMEKYGGEIDVTSEPGKTAFFGSFPRDRGITGGGKEGEDHGTEREGAER